MVQVKYESSVISPKQEPQREEKNMIPNQIRSAQSVEFLDDSEFCDEIPEKLNVVFKKASQL